MQICPFRKKISSVNSQLSKEINFEILYFVIYNTFYFAKFCYKNFTYGALWLVNWPVFTNTEWSVDDVVSIAFESLFPTRMCSLLKEKKIVIFISK